MTKKLDVCGRQAGPQSSCQTHFISPSALHRVVMVDLMMINICKKRKITNKGEYEDDEWHNGHRHRVLKFHQ